MLRGFAAWLRDPGTGRLGTRPGTARPARRVPRRHHGGRSSSTSGPKRATFDLQGDRELADALAGAKAIPGLPPPVHAATNQQRSPGQAIPDQIFKHALGEHAFALRRFGSVWGSDTVASYLFEDFRSSILI